MKIIRTSLCIAALGLAPVAAGCGSGDYAPDPAPTASTVPEAAQPESHPDPVVSIDVGGGKTVELYDFGEGRVLVMETGKAGGELVLPRYGDLIHSGRLVDIVKSLRPDLEVPASVIDLQARSDAAMVESVAQPKPRFTVKGPVPAGTSTNNGGSVIVPETTCGNYCCDYDWLQNTMCYDYGCSGGGCTYSWFNYDYGWSVINSTEVAIWQGAACSASGTSTFFVSVSDGSGGTWSVGQGYYRYYSWIWGSDFENFATGVNSQSNEHLHTYCGGVDYG
jgi:hypothetical protein